MNSKLIEEKGRYFMNKHISNIQDSVNDANKNISKVQNLLDQFPNAEGADINADNVAKDLAHISNEVKKLSK